MSLIVSGIRLPFEVPSETACESALTQCGLSSGDPVCVSIYRTSIDRRHGKIDRVYSVRIDGVEQEEAVCERLADPAVRVKRESPLEFTPGSARLEHRPVIIGLGPAGLFAAYVLAQCGYRPIVLERGREIGERDRAVERFWSGGAFDAESNIQFGEGGAGAYSDGKLTTRINDPFCDEVLRIFVRHGMPEDVSLLAKPHVGTDILKNIVRSMREQIVAWGGEVHFSSRLEGIRVKNGVLTGLVVNGQETPSDVCVLAIGHSARDTFFCLDRAGIYFEPKPFSVGVRVEHLQSEIDRALYGKYAGHPLLPAGEYALSYRKDGRACYSFCMCPGGQVVAAQSEERTVVTNGMSYHARDGKNANAALAVSVDPSDYEDGTPFGGIAFQRQIEQAAFRETGSYATPCQLVGDFLDGRRSHRFGTVQPTYPIGTRFVPLDRCLPQFVVSGLRDGLQVFARKLPAFQARDAVLTAPETRTSSPVRIRRREDLQSLRVDGLIPCGEGAGYAGGIMSAAVDGIRAAKQIIETYRCE